MQFISKDPSGRYSQLSNINIDDNLPLIEVYENAGHIRFEGEYNGPYYLENNELIPCLDYDLNTIPVPCDILIDGQQFRAEEVVEFEFDAPGLYQIQIKPDDIRYLIKVFEYENNL